MSVVCWHKRKIKAVNSESLSEDHISTNFIPTNLNVSHCGQIKKETQNETGNSNLSNNLVK